MNVRVDRGPLRAQPGSEPKVSVCVPAYQAEAFIGATIESVLAQTYADWELVILDNNSQDRTREIALSYADSRIRVEKNTETVGLAENWNAVASLAAAPYLKLLCADDLLHPTCLAEQVEVLENNPDVVVVASRRNFVGSDGEVVLEDRGLSGLIGAHQAESVVERVVRSGINPIGWPAALLFRRSVFVDVGAFDERWNYPIDLELVLRMLRQGAFFGMSRSLASFRISPGSASSTMKHEGRQHRELLQVVGADPRWSIGKLTLARGLTLSYVETIKKRLLFRSVNSRWLKVRRLPGLFLGLWPQPPGIHPPRVHPPRVHPPRVHSVTDGGADPANPLDGVARVDTASS